MKIVAKIISLTFLSLLLFACEISDDASMPETNNVSFDKGSYLLKANALSGDCAQISGPVTDLIRYVGETKTYTVSHNLGSNLPVQWSIVSGSGISIIGSTTSNSVTVRFGSSFTGGTIKVVISNCDSRLTINTAGALICPTDTAPDRPGPITFDIFLGSNPSNADFCINTTANALWIDGVECAQNYIWSITPNVFGTNLEPNPNNGLTALLSVSQPGDYVVSVRAVGSNGLTSPARSISLKAERCSDGGGSF